ncbi:unnamed protein product [Cylicocyclus nassatus]|uniref:Uncharacterized protein n=1 Tax=Cylicocyclus nassatus TaxID=53992 RepID=A0AA36GK94_CYLNA|nr:unnamed protein product [Cylicocyclus nassatus]
MTRCYQVNAPSLLILTNIGIVVDMIAATIAATVADMTVVTVVADMTVVTAVADGVDLAVTMVIKDLVVGESKHDMLVS